MACGTPRFSDYIDCKLINTLLKISNIWAHLILAYSFFAPHLLVMVLGEWLGH